MNVHFTLKDYVEVVCGFVFPHNDCPVRSHPFGTVRREPTKFLFSQPLQKLNIPQRCHYFGYGRRMRRRRCAELTVAVDHCGGLPLCLFLYVACHLVFALSRASPSALRWSLPILPPP